MKTIKFFAALTIMLGFTMGAMAQAQVDANITANASVQTQLLVTELQPLEFGTVDNVVDQTKVVSTLGVATSSGGAPGQTGVQQGVGKIVRTGDAHISYKLISPPSLLVGPGDEGSESKLPIGSYVTAYSFAVDGGQTAGGETVTNDTVVEGEGTDIFIHIGATVTPSALTTTIGLHTAEVTLSAEYN